MLLFYIQRLSASPCSGARVVGNENSVAHDGSVEVAARGGVVVLLPRVVVRLVQQGTQLVQGTHAAASAARRWGREQCATREQLAATLHDAIQLRLDWGGAQELRVPVTPVEPSRRPAENWVLPALGGLHGELVHGRLLGVMLESVSVSVTRVIVFARNPGI